jgi:hypothetical protein
LIFWDLSKDFSFFASSLGVLVGSSYLKPEQPVMNYNYQAPDLASVLATLSALNQQSQAAAGQAVTATQPYPNPLPPQNGAQAQNSQTWRQIVQPQALPPKEQALPKMTDPATITDWPSGLRCVMKTVAINERIIQDIKRVWVSSCRCVSQANLAR